METMQIVIGKNGNVANAPKDFNLYLGGYGNVEIAVAVPIDLLGGFEVGENQSIQTMVKVGLKWTTDEGDMGQTQALNLELAPERDYEDNGTQYRVFVGACPQVFTAQTGRQKLVCNIVNSLIDGENADIQSLTTTAEIPFLVLPSAVLKGQIIQEQEEINELEQVQGAVNSLISETDILKNTKLDKQSDIETVYTINADGEQTQVPYSQNPQEGAIVQRGANGAVKTGIPTEDEDATPKKYVDDYNAGQDEIIQDKADKVETVLKYNVASVLPNGVEYNKNGYKTPGVLFSGETFAIPFYTGQLPQNETGAVRVFNVRDFAQSETQKYQDEIFEFKGGNAMRTILIDFEDGGNPVVLEVGAWGNVCQELFDDIDNRINGLQTVDKGGALHYIVTDNFADPYFVDIDINNFNAYKTQFNLTKFACADIWGEGDFYYEELATVIFDYENDTTTAIKSLYWKNASGAIYKITDIFNGTWVVNQSNGHQYRLDNNKNLDTFWWSDKGIDLTQVATNNKHGVTKGVEDNGENDYKVAVDINGEMGVNLSQAKRDAIESGASVQKFVDIDEEIADEILARENADEELQAQIDENTTTREDLGLNGFVNYQQANFSFDNATRTLEINAMSIPYEFYVQSKKFEKETDNFVISNAEGMHHIYYDIDGVLREMVGVYSTALILQYCFVATVYWDAENQKAVYVANEWRHGIKMSSATHLRLHAQDGFVVTRGGELTDISIGGDGSLDTHCQVGATTTTAYDEDALFQPMARSPLANLPLLWQVGNSWRSKESDPFPVIVGANGRAVYNGTISGVRGLIEAESGKFVTCHIAVTNDASRPYIGFMGQVQYNGVSEARGLIIDEIKSFYAQGLPMQELQFLGTLLIQTSDTFTNSVKSRTLSIDTGVYYVDLRQLVTPRGSITIGMGGGESIIHNDTTGIQGGGEGEYYHLTTEQVALVDDIPNKATKFSIKQYQVPVRNLAGEGEANTGVGMSSAAVAGSIMSRNANGQTSVANGTDPLHAVNKGQLDVVINNTTKIANAYNGFAAGAGASATSTGGAVGYLASATYGGAVGWGASETNGGGAVGAGASVTGSTSTGAGGAIGNGASAAGGGAIGHGAKTGAGFAGGYNAKTVNNNNVGIDAVQLGTGTNSTPKTLQVYDYPLMNANGTIPIDRMSSSVYSSVNKPSFNDLKRINLRGYTGGAAVWWYYKLAAFPIDNSGNDSSLIIIGRIGGWVKSNISLANIVCSNRDGDYGNLINLGYGTAGLETCRVQIYRQTDGSSIAYLAVKSYFAFDINVNTWNCTATYDGTYVTTPVGTLNWDSYTTTNRLGIYSGAAYVASGRLAIDNEVVHNTISDVKAALMLLGTV